MINCRVLALPSQAFYEAGGHDVPAKVTTALCTACRRVACRSLARRPCSCSRAVLATQALRLNNLGSDTPTDGQAPAGFPAGRGSFDERQHREHREPDCFVLGSPRGRRSASTNTFINSTFSWYNVDCSAPTPDSAGVSCQCQGSEHKQTGSGSGRNPCPPQIPYEKTWSNPLHKKVGTFEKRTIDW